MIIKTTLVCISTFKKSNYILQRNLTTQLHRAMHTGGPVLLQGPSGSGKTFLVRNQFPRLRHISLQDAADRRAARGDPETFIARIRGVAFIDDLQRAPELVGYYMRAVQPGPMLLASSRKLALPITTLTLYDPTRAELTSRRPLRIEMLGYFVPSPHPASEVTPSWATEKFPSHAQLAGLVHPHDQDRFEAFARLASERSGQVLDQQALAGLAGVSRTTAGRWLAALDSCFVTFRVQASDLHCGRRLIRAPKLHFVRSTTFETMVVSELYRNTVHSGVVPELRYWRDSNGMEIELVSQLRGSPPMPILITARPNPSDYARLQRWTKLAGVHSAAMVSLSSGQERSGRVLRYTLDQL